MAKEGNAAIAELLDLIAYFYRLEKNTYRALSYEKAAKAVGKHPYLILSGSQAKEEIRGIGESIAEDIDLSLRKAPVPRLEGLKEKFQERIPVVELFAQLFGVGPVKANHYYDLGYRTLEDLYFGTASLPPVLTAASRLSLQYRLQLALRIPRREIDLAREDIGQLFPASYLWEIAGSYRRGEADSGDIDLLLRAKDQEGRPVRLAEAVGSLRPLLVGDLALGEVMYMGILRLSPAWNFNARRLDILLVPAENWGPALLHFTGSREFNILLRQRAKDLGFSLNEKRLTGPLGPVPAESEEKIFALLGVKYLPPEGRVKGLDKLELD